MSALKVVMLPFFESWLTIGFVSWVFVRGICAVVYFSNIQNVGDCTKLGSRVRRVRPIVTYVLDMKKHSWPQQHLSFLQ
jgi:hypothetical protein